jgi:hypothetical protein
MLATLFLLTAATSIFVEQPPNEILSTGGPRAAATVISAHKGEVFYRQPLGRPNVKSLQVDLEFTYKGQTARITREEQLLQSSVLGSGGDKLMYRHRFYCTVARLTGKRRIVGMSEVGMTGMDLDKIKKLRNVQTHNCVVDTDGDGLVDRAVIADTSDREEIVPVAVTPTMIRDNGVQTMPGESEARLVFDGLGGIIGNMSVSLEIFEEGKRLAFGNGQVLFRGDSVPRTLDVFGAKVTVLAYDNASKTAQIKVERGFSGGPYQVQMTFGRRY